MATLADLVRRQRRSGASASGALFTAVGQKTLAAVDPRKMFNQTGLLTALFPSLRAYRPDSPRSRVDAASKELSGSSTPLLEQMVVKLDSVDMTMRLVAKNTMAMPGMSRDMNIMRQNVVKLVKLQGGKASTRADAFFLRAFERERATESELQASKERRSTGAAKAPTALKERISGIPLIGPILATITAPFFKMAENLQKFFDKFVDGLGSFFSIKGAKSLFGNILGSMTRSLGRFGGIFRTLAAGLGGTGFVAIGALAALFYGMYKLFSDEKTEYNKDKGDSFGSEMGQDSRPWWVDPDRPKSNLPAELDESDRIRKLPEYERTREEISRYEKLFNDGQKLNEKQLESFAQRGEASAKAVNDYKKGISGTSPTSATTPQSTSPRLVPSLSSGELGGVNYSSYAQTIGERESGGNYKAVNSLGYLGKYQFGAMALEDMGLVKRGVGAKGQKALDDPSNWTIDGGKEAFLNNPSLQEQIMLKYTKMNFERLKNLGVIGDNTTAEKIAGFLASAHLVGPGGAAAMSRGEMRKDAYGTSAQSYFKIGSASQDNISPVLSSSGTQIASASTAVSGARQQMSSQPIIVNAPNVNSGSNKQKQVAQIPNTTDTELFNALFDRTTMA